MSLLLTCLPPARPPAPLPGEGALMSPGGPWARLPNTMPPAQHNACDVIADRFLFYSVLYHIKVSRWIYGADDRCLLQAVRTDVAGRVKPTVLCAQPLPTVQPASCCWLCCYKRSRKFLSNVQNIGLHQHSLTLPPSLLAKTTLLLLALQAITQHVQHERSCCFLCGIQNGQCDTHLVTPCCACIASAKAPSLAKASLLLLLLPKHHAEPTRQALLGLQYYCTFIHIRKSNRQRLPALHNPGCASEQIPVQLLSCLKT